MSRRADRPIPRAAMLAFRLLVRLHPRWFRERYGRELRTCFADAWVDEVRGRGLAAALAFWARTVWGAVDTSWRQRSRARRGGVGMTRWSVGGRDLSTAWRGLARRPAWAAVVVLTLGVGMGATTAVFSVLNGVLLAPLPYGDGDRLVRIYNRRVGTGMDRLHLSNGAATELRDQTRTLQAVAILEEQERGANLMVADRPERVRVLRVAAGYFDALGITLARGREFTRSEERDDARVAVVTAAVASRALGSEGLAPSGTITLGGTSWDVVGVVPSARRDPVAGSVDVWLPANLESAGDWTDNHLDAVARLAPGADLASARAELSTLAAGHAELGPAAAEKAYTTVPLRDDLAGDVRPLLAAVMGAAAFLLLLTCTSVASLLLARTATRERELAIRRTLGCGRTGIVRLLVIETGLLAVAGTVASLAIGSASLEVLLAIAPSGLPLRESIGFGAGPLAFAAVLAVLVAGGLGVAIAIPWSRRRFGADLATADRSGAGGRGARRIRELLVVADVALAVVLLIGAGVLFRTVEALQARDLGVRTEGVLAFQADLAGPRYGDPTARTRFQDTLLSRLAALPDVERAGSVSHLPVTGSHNTWGTRLADAPQGRGELDNRQFDQRVVDGDYFGVVGIPLLSGRLLRSSDHANAARAVLVDRTAAEVLVGDGDPVGRQLVIGSLRAVVVGVVGDVAVSARRGAVPTVYHAFDQFGAFQGWPMHHVVRVPSDAAEPWAAVRAAVRAVDPTLTTHGTVRLDEVVREDIAHERFAALLVRAFAAIATLLAALGLFGVLAHAVERRRHELGVRFALGADAAALRGLVLRRGLSLALAGTVLGVACAFPLARGLASLVYGVGTRDPAVFLAVPAVVTLLAAVSSWLPAVGATTVTPRELLGDD